MPGGEARAALAQEVEAKWRELFAFGDECRGKELVCFRDGAEDEGAPADAEQIFEALRAVGKAVHARGDLIAEDQKLGDEAIEGQALRNGASEERAGTVQEIAADILQIVAKLKESAPFEGKARFVGSHGAASETRISEDRGAALGETELEKIAIGEQSVTVELRKAVLLRVMDGKEAVVNKWKLRAGILRLDHRDKGPHAGLAKIEGGKNCATETLTKTMAEGKFVGRGDAGGVEVVVGVGIKQAVSEDGGRDGRGGAKQGLKAAGGPCIAAGLDGVFTGDGGIKGACAAGKLDAGREKKISEQAGGPGVEVEGVGGKAGEGGEEPALSRGTTRGRWRGCIGFVFHGVQGCVVGALARLVVAHGVAWAGPGLERSAVTPDLGSASDVGIDPGKLALFVHAAERYGIRRMGVPRRERRSFHRFHMKAPKGAVCSKMQIHRE